MSQRVRFALAFSVSAWLTVAGLMSISSGANAQMGPPVSAQPSTQMPSGTDSPKTPGCGLNADVETALSGLFAAPGAVAYTGTLLIEYNNEREFVGVSSADEQGRGSLLRLSREVSDAPESVLLPPVSPRSPCGLAPFYAFAMEAGQVVAGRAAYRLTVRPKDTLRLGYIMDVDSEHHIPLRVVTATADGQVLERFEFADINFGATPDTAPLREPGGRPHFGFAKLPPGFSVIDHGVTPVDFLVVSDGLAAVSVFIEPRPQALADGEGVVLRGATIAYTRGTLDNHLITVLGEIPVTTARLLADAVRREAVER